MAKQVALNNTVNALPSFLQEFASAKDTSTMDASDFSMPSIALVQPTSEIAGEDPTKIGKFVNSLTGEVMDTIQVYNLAFQKVFRVTDGDGGDDQQYYGSFLSREEAEAEADKHAGAIVAEGHRNYVVRADVDTGLAPAIMHMSSKSAVRASRDWNTAITMEYGNVPRQALIWTLTAKKVKSKKSSAVFYVPEAQVTGQVPDIETMRSLVDMAKTVVTQ